MKIFLIMLLTCSQVWAGFPPTTLSGQSDTTKPTTFNFVTPYNQATIIGASTALYENGSNNLLKNPSFEATSGITNWTAASGSVAADETTNIFAGKKSQLMTLTAVNGLSLSQDITPTIQMLGSNFEASVAIKTSLTTLKVCARQAAATFGTCATVQGDGNWHVYSVNMPGPSSGSVGVSVITTSSTTGTYYVDAGYVGLARNLGNGVPNNVFSAKISAAGVVSDENQDFINGNCSITDTSLLTCTYNSNFFSTTPSCTHFVAAATDPLTGSNTAQIDQSGTSSSQIRYRTQAGGIKQAIAVQLICTRSSTDWVQPTIQAPNWDTDWTAYTLTIGAVTTPPTPGAGAVKTAKWRRVGDSMEIMFTYAQTAAGSAGSGTYLFPLPTGYSIDTNKISLSTNGTGAAGTTIGNGTASTTTTAGASATDMIFATGYNSTNLALYFNSYATGISNMQASPISSLSFSLLTSTLYISFTAKVPIQGWTKTLNAPLLVGSVTSNATGALRNEYAIVSTTCTTTPCTISKTSSNWLTNITRLGLAGYYSLNFASGTFSDTPACSCFGGGFVGVSCTINTESSSAVSFITSLGATAADTNFRVTCIGPR